ncbi:Fur family transcriptional regulator [Mycolicibacterium palauense]|uniref:Fur family transcriptional regulator n=1 Tax=Mycolicibacterium palauense TaxID=2034511 RepID=UPI000BFECFF6|nr:transcriptional repressor [Mycolicibacterium palauense]
MQRPRRATAQQHAVLRALQDSDRFRSAQQLYVELRQTHSLRIGLTSIYRILHVLAEERVAETQRAENGELLYRIRTAPEHRHYLLCRRCGRAVAFTASTLKGHADQPTQEHRYAEVTHHLDIYGICPRCQNNPRDHR